MMNNFFRRTAAGILALSLMGSAAVSCGSSDQPKTKPKQTADQVVQNSYRAMELDSSISFDYVEQMISLGDSGKILITGGTEDEMGMFITDSEFANYEKVDMQLDLSENSEHYFRTTVASDGTIYALVTITEYASEMPDYKSPEFESESFDWEAFYASAKTKYLIVSIGQDGKVISKNEIKGLDKYSSEDDEMGGVYIDSLIPCSDGKLILCISGEQSIYVTLGEDGSLGDEIDLGDDVWIYNSCITTDGRLAFSAWDEGSNSQAIKFIETDSFKVSDDVINLKDTSISNISALLPGANGYALYASGQAGLYAIKEDGSGEELINWIDSDLNGDYIRGVVALEDGDFIILEQNWSTGGTQFYRITKRDSSELENTIVVTLGLMYSDPNITSKINDFNKASDKYRIRISDYSKYDEWDDEAEKMTNTSSKQLKMDIIAGNAPDMIYTYDLSVVKSLANKDVYADLYEFLGTNGTVSKDDLIPSVLTAGECNGKLLSLSPSFTINTVAAKKKFVDHDNWTLDELIETYDNLPSGMKLFDEGNTKEAVFSRLTNGCCGFIDYATSTCSFNSEEFVKLLEFADRFSDTEDTPDWENASQEEMDKYYDDMQVACRNDKALLSFINIYSGREYAQAKTGKFGEDISLVGYPSSDGKGGQLNLGQSFAILNNASDKEACWQFISQFFTAENYENTDVHMMDGLPTVKSEMTKILDATMEKPYWEDESGKKEYYDDTYWMGNDGDEIVIPPLTKEERDALEKYICEASSSNVFFYNNEVTDIVDEEVKSFFAGERSAQETADMIQNRVSLLISEQS